MANENLIWQTGQSECVCVCKLTAHLAQKSASMKKLFLILFCTAFAVAITGCCHFCDKRTAAKITPPPDLIAQIHFAGAEKISQDTNSVAFTNLFCSSEAQELRGQTLNKLARAPYQFLQKRMTVGASDETARLRPLLDDLLRAEWFLQTRDATNGSPEFALAVCLDKSRAELWRTNLADILESWTKLSVEKIHGGWQMKKHLPPDLIRFVRVGDWIVLGCGQDELPLNDEIVRRVRAEKRPAAAKNNWLSADLDWPRLARWLAPLQKFDLPKTQLQVTGSGNNLRLNGKFIFPQSLDLPLEKWRLPTNTIHEPFDSFTAARGFTPWLEKQKWAQPFKIEPMPDQIFIWALNQIPFQTFAAVPVSDATNAIRQLGGNLSAVTSTNFQNAVFGLCQLTTNGSEIVLRGFPFISPFVQNVRESSGDFLLAGLSPNSPDSGPLPKELFATLAPANLVFYHWEITAERLPEVRPLSQFTLMITRRNQLDGKSAAAKWLDHISPTLGNTSTTITQTAPDELTFTRRAPGGLIAIEFVALANWLESTNFPLGGFQLPPLQKNNSLQP
jgi:hypothetical protein